MNIHLYLMCFRHEALVASHLPPEEFGAYMAVGTRRNTFGNVMFFEIDRNLDSPELKTDQIESICAPHADGHPHRSKYISIYRAMEFVPQSAFGKLYLTTRDGRVLGLDGHDFGSDAEGSGGPYMYCELCPVTPRVVSNLSPAAFISRITDPNSLVHVPRIFIAETQLARDADGHIAGYLPYRDPKHIEDCLNVIAGKADTLGKTVDRDPPLVAFYRTIASGFYVGNSQGIKHYPYPSLDELEENHHTWWRSALMG
jgi:hypothetical protein